MRLLCVARHEYLSSHLCRYFSDLGVVCESAVGLAEASVVASSFEPHLVIAEADLLSPAVLARWSGNAALRDVPVLAVSLNCRQEENVSYHESLVAGVIYLPTLERSDALALLEGALRERGVKFSAGLPVPRHAAAH